MNNFSIFILYAECGGSYFVNNQIIDCNNGVITYCNGLHGIRSYTDADDFINYWDEYKLKKIKMNYKR